MSQHQCAINDCKRASRTLCHCCNQNLCRDHFNQHDDLLNSQLNPLTDEINALADRLSAINIDKLNNDSRRKLNQWRLDSHQLIDRFYEQKCAELDQYVSTNMDQQRRDITKLRSKMNELIEKQETTTNDIHSLTKAIGSLAEKMNEIEQMRVCVDIHPLLMDDSLIRIGQSVISGFSLSSLSAAFGTVKRSQGDSCNALSSNNRFLLTDINGQICLIDENLSIVKQKQWEYDYISDICWSSTLKIFIIIAGKNVLLVNENTMLIKPVQHINNNQWYFCGCSDKSLYLSREAWDSSVFEFPLLPTIQYKKVWKIDDREQREQRVDAIVYNGGNLALSINDRSNQAKLIELRSAETFSVLWSTKLDVVYNDRVLRCCLLKYDEWLVADWYSSRLFRINNQGKIQEVSTYPSTPYNVNLFCSNILAILTRDGVDFHKLQ